MLKAISLFSRQNLSNRVQNTEICVLSLLLLLRANRQADSTSSRLSSRVVRTPCQPSLLEGRPNQRLSSRVVRFLLLLRAMPIQTPHIQRLAQPKIKPPPVVAPRRAHTNPTHPASCATKDQHRAHVGRTVLSDHIQQLFRFEFLKQRRINHALECSTHLR